jgi:hypothetical protein
MLLLCGILLWFSPAQRAFYSLLSIVLALGSWITSNLGGFFIGMLFGLVGGALAFAWSTGSERQPLTSSCGGPQIPGPSWALDLILHPTAVLPPPGRVAGSLARELAGPGERALDPADESATSSPDGFGTPGPAADGPAADGPAADGPAAHRPAAHRPLTTGLLTGVQGAVSWPPAGDEVSQEPRSPGQG